MRQIPRIFYRPTTQIWFYVGLPLFFLVFVLLYEPQSIVRFLGAGQEIYVFNLLMVSAILMAVLAVFRNLLFVLRKLLRLNWMFYTFWCVAETVIAAFFTGLYMTLISHGAYAYFPAVGYSLGYLLLVLCFPYIILSLAVFIAGERDETVDDESLMRFYDNTRKLKLVVAPSAVLCVEARENYVVVRYVEGNRIKDYMLRCSMKSLEAVAAKHGLVRCQRSYYVNPQHVKVLRRDKDGIILAELDNPEVRAVPVSPRYYDALSQLL